MNSLSRKAEDYLEAILKISTEKGYAQTGDVAYELGIRSPSVVEMFKRLGSMGLVIYRPYKGVQLTDEGKIQAGQIKSRHDTMRTFLILIGVPKDIADRDACIMEHELHPRTIGQIKRLTDSPELKDMKI